ncbi:MAG TPA: signal peptidase II [Phycisphaerales bacterium]|nr:signal peptidase II [Phycisphaerales bacterium]
MADTSTKVSSARISQSRAFFKQMALSLPDAKTHLIFWSLMVGGLALDLWTKKAIFDWLKPEETFPIINGFLRLIIAVNNGAAFNLFAGKPYFLAAVSIIAILAIFAAFLFSGNMHKLVHIALGLFAAGVCGNLYDRLFNNGSVRDFIDVYRGTYHWPTFNVADSLLCIGVGLLIISTFIIEKPAQKHDQQHK